MNTLQRRLIATLVGLGCVFPCFAEPAAATALEANISALGELNGIALACRQMALSTRLRDIVIHQAPKERNIGERFEQATSESFLRQGQADHACPDSKTLAADIDRAQATLQHLGRPQP